MSRSLQSKRRGPAEGQAERLVMFLHGYGADGADLLGLADPLSPHLPGTAFVAPDAPERSQLNPMGFQWFPIPWIDGSDPAEAEAALDRSAGDLNAFIDETLAAEGLTPDRLAVIGFSQGTMLALEVVLGRGAPIAALVGFSGRLLRPDALEDTVKSRPPILLLHGDADEVVPPQSLPDAATALQSAGLDVYAHVMKGTAHGIGPDGLSVALAFLRDKFGLDG